ncbi:MAG: hypothetical protein NTX25_13625, partial [Proteobacteria bacterium]|nr:hypothetical protein [Pseudomonadota bacterium]
MHCGIYDGRKIWAAPWIANSVLSLDTSSKAMSISPINGCGTSTVGCGRCLYDGRFMYSSSTNGVHKVDLQTGAMETVSTSINGGIPMHDGSYLWSLESNPGLHVRRTQMKTGDSIMYPDWAGAGETPNLNAGGCGLYDGRHYWINLDQKIIQFDTQTGQKIASYTLAGPVSTQSQRNMLSCAFDGENIWLAATAGTEVYKLSSARPSTSPTELLIPEGHVQFLGKEVFAGAFHDAAQKTMARISIRQLPQHGQLKLGKTVVQEGAVIAAEQLSELNYQAQADYRGPDQFLFRAAHASESSTVDETFKLRIGQLRSSDGFGESGLIPRGIALPETVIARGFKLGLERPSLGEQNFAGASFDGNDLWLLPRDADQVLRVERSSGKTSSFSEWPSGLKHSAGAFLGGVFDGRRLWLIPDKAEQLVRIERETGVMQSFSQWPEGFTKQAGSFAGGVFDGQRIWLIPAHANRLISIDPVTGKMGSESVWPLGFDGNEASKFDGGLYDGQSIWLIPSSAKSLIRVDHDTGIMRAYNNWPQGFAAQSLAKFRGGTFDGHRLWLAPRQAKVLLAVDRDTGEMTSYGEWPAGLNLGPDAFAGAVYD